MEKLGIWRIDDPAAADAAPRRVKRSQIALEARLEKWIVNDPTLIGDGLAIVGQQVTIDGGRLDLLAIDRRERWVVIEIKPGLLDSGALFQALSYAASIARLDADELRGKLKPGLGRLGDDKQLAAAVEEQLRDEPEQREVALLLVGTDIDPGLERTTEFLERFQVPVEFVSFEVFELDAGPKLLVREVHEEPPPPPVPRRKYTVDAIRERASEEGERVLAQFNRFVDMSEAAGLPVQPQRASVRPSPPTNRTRYLMYASPRDGGLVIYAESRKFAEFFPHIREKQEEAAAALDSPSDGRVLTGDALDERLNQIKEFLTENFPPPDNPA